MNCPYSTCKIGILPPGLWLRMSLGHECDCSYMFYGTWQVSVQALLTPRCLYCVRFRVVKSEVQRAARS